MIDLRNSDVGWIVDNKFYVNRLRAWEAANGNRDSIHFYFKDNEMDAYDFSVDPGNWHELLKNRCLKLREENDYLCLWYSAGTDSYTIYNIFKNYNIPLDEIIFHDKTYNPYPYYETERQIVFKHVQEFQKHQPNCRFTVMETGYMDAEPFYKKQGADWIYYPFVTYRFSKPLRSLWLERRTDIAERLLAPGTINIQGSDPPRLFLQNGKWYHVVFDTHEFDTCAIPTFYNFFWDDLDIMCKQAHMAARYFEKIPGVDQEFVQKMQRHEFLMPYRDYMAEVGRDLPNDEFLCSGKNKWGTMSRTSKYHECTNLEKYAQDNHPEIWKTFINGMEHYEKSNIQTLWAKLRYLKDFEVNN
jgi:hypothetical protein